MVRCFIVALIPALCAAEVCGRDDFSGAYGFLLAGTNTISGAPKPAAAVGRLVFEGGKVTGYSSVNFDGYFLGNPVTGKYESRTDCSAEWSLQDDSGAFQHFAGTLAPGGAKAEFHQTDPGTGGRGQFARTPAACNNAVLRGRYRYSFAGRTTPFASGKPESVSGQSVVEADGAGMFTYPGPEREAAGTYTVDGDCFVEIDFGAKLRGIVVSGGDTVLAIETDPGRAASGTFRRLPPALE